jgi:protein arginine N-methyltransferase 5
MRIPLINEDMSSSNETEMWERWNKFRTFCENHSKLSVGEFLNSFLSLLPLNLLVFFRLSRIALELPVDLPDEDHLERWFAEPIKAIILPTKIFLTNAKGYPVLSKKHQAFIKKLMKVCIYFSTLCLITNISFLTNCKIFIISISQILLFSTT